MRYIAGALCRRFAGLGRDSCESYQLLAFDLYLHYGYTKPICHGWFIGYPW